MKWWGRLSIVQRVAFVALIVAILGMSGALIWDYALWPFMFLGLTATAVNAVILFRRGLKAPVPGRTVGSRREIRRAR